MASKKFPRLAFVDLETTGGTATEDRITEIGIVEVDEGGVREWSSLVNPEMHIPEFIQSLTGISNAMVADAPVFADIADEVAKRLDDRIFIAHNARFDYGFLKNEFARLGHPFRPAVLCTVRLSRKLFPGFARHNLDAIAERHRLVVTERHRALGDAQLIWQFWNRLHESHAPEAIEAAVSSLLSRPTLPSRLNDLEVSRMPATPGVYLFYGENDLPLYIGKAANLRRRVLAHFSGDHVSSREAHMTQQIQRVKWIETGGEIGALLQEAMLVKKLLPQYNQQLRGSDEILSWRLASRRGRLLPMLVRSDDMFFGYDPDLYGLYTSTRKAGDALRALCDKHALCRAVLGIEKTAEGKPCFASQVGKCLGACTGKESLARHNERVLEALAPQRLTAWPFPGAIAIREGEWMHVVDGWIYQGSTRDMGEAAVMASKGRGPFDPDIYRVLCQRLPRARTHILTNEEMAQQDCSRQ